MELITDIAKYFFVRKPAAAITEIRSGKPQCYSQFWNRISVGEFYAIYTALQCSPSKVLDMQCDEARDFLRFVTGSSCNVIAVTFCASDGLARRPIGHTCTCTLELSTSYSSFLEFVSEFRSVLCNELAWKMDAI